MPDFANASAVTPGGSDQRRWVVVGLLSLGMIVAYLSRSNLSVVLAIVDFVRSDCFVFPIPNRWLCDRLHRTDRRTNLFSHPGPDFCCLFTFGPGPGDCQLLGTQTLVPAAAIGRVSGVHNCAASVAGIVAPILTGWLNQQSGSYKVPMQVIWFVLVGGILSYLLFMRQEYAPATRLEQCIRVGFC